MSREIPITFETADANLLARTGQIRGLRAVADTVVDDQLTRPCSRSRRGERHADRALCLRPQTRPARLRRFRRACRARLLLSGGGGGWGYPSLVAQAVHRIELRGARGRNRPEDNPDQ
jgi:hypothetical protein